MRFTLLIFITFLFACNNSTETTGNTDVISDTQQNNTTEVKPGAQVPEKTETTNDADIKPVTVESSVSTNCYTYDKDGSKVNLRVVLNGNAVTGNLDYALKEKDKNSGIIAGEMHGDTLIANYIFAAEGKKSRREVAFLKKGNDMIEGYGEQQQEGAKFVFKNRNALQFPGTMVLKGKSCL